FARRFALATRVFAEMWNRTRAAELPMNLRHITSIVIVGFAVTSCSGARSENTQAGEQDIDNDRARHDAGGGDSGDGPPTRQAGTTSFGDGLRGAYGRLDGFVVAVLAPKSGLCNADRHHVHVQVAASGATYDVAVNTDSGFMARKDLRLPGSAWAEGW